MTLRKGVAASSLVTSVPPLQDVARASGSGGQRSSSSVPWPRHFRAVQPCLGWHFALHDHQAQHATAGMVRHRTAEPVEPRLVETHARLAALLHWKLDNL